MVRAIRVNRRYSVNEACTPCVLIYVRTAIRLTVIVLLLLTAGAIFVTEGALHIWKRPAPWSGAADALSRQNGGTWTAVKVNAADGIPLDGWLFTPHAPNGAAVIALHGVGDTRLGMLAHAAFLLGAGYTVLTPDCRGHGASGGDVITYGVREAGDVHAWADLLMRQPGISRLYGIGQSMGASILLESSTGEPRFRALVADCPFATFDEIAHERLAQHGGPLARVFAVPMVPLGFAYAGARYGVDLRHASPVAAVHASNIPVLLIHGTVDANIPPHHSRELHAANPAATELWEVAGADHIESLGTAKQEYVRRVLAWFDTHR